MSETNLEHVNKAHRETKYVCVNKLLYETKMARVSN